MRFLQFLIVGLVLLLAGTSGAANENSWTECGDDTKVLRAQADTHRLRMNPGSRICFRFNNSLTTQDQVFTIPMGATVRLCLEPDSTGAVATATANPKICVPDGTFDTDTCEPVVAAVLTGAGGGTSQRRCVWLEFGDYLVTLVDPDASDEAILSLERP